MKTKIISILLILSLTTTLFGAPFYQNLTINKKKELAIAYYFVGQRFIEIGKSRKGKSFEKMAFELYPLLEKETISESSFNTTETTTTTTTTTTTVGAI